MQCEVLASPPSPPPKKLTLTLTMLPDITFSSQEIQELEGYLDIKENQEGKPEGSTLY
jgi:hypothetical protein